MHGRMEALDQGIRSIDYRLRAVEKRLSVKTPENDLIVINDIDEKDAQSEIEELRKSVEILSNNLQAEVSRLNNKITPGGTSPEIEALIADTEHRITKLENLNKITIGKIKVPIEFSGLLAAAVLIITGYLIFVDQWDIIRSFYYPVTIGMLFGVVVIAKFLMMNKE